MSHAYSGNDANNPSAITVMDDGDPPTAATFATPLEGLMDKVVHILNGDTEFSGNKTWDGSSMSWNNGGFVFNIPSPEINFTDLANPTQITFVRPPTILIDDNIHTRGVGGYGTNLATGAIVWPTGVTLPFGDTWQWPLLELPNGASMRKLGVRIDPANDTLPATKVRLQLVATPVGAGGGSTVLATVEDPLTGAGYQAAHDFEADISGFDIELDLEAFTYWIRIVGETGGDEDNVAIEGAPWVEYSAGSVDLGR